MKTALLLLSLLFTGSPAPAQQCRQYDDYMLVGDIGEDEVVFFAVWLAKANNPRILIHSGGGIMDAGLAIMTMVKQHGRVRCEVRGFAGSGAFGVLQTCAHRAMASSSRLMTHEPRRFAGAVDRYGAADILRQFDYSTPLWNGLMRARLKVTREEYESKVRRQDWTMDAKEALRVGAVDEILE
jgi:ATP-dependent protease ClpP protease subunit